MTKDEMTKTAIIDAAKVLFQQYGLAKTTMEDIAKAIGKGKSSLYYYYDTKEEIFQSVVDKEKEEIERDIIDAVGREHTAVEKLKAFAQTKYRALRRRQLLYRLKTIGLNSEGSATGCIFNAIKARYNEHEEDIVKGILLFGIREGSFDSAYQSQIDLMTKVCTNMLRGIQMELSFGSFKGSAGDLLDTAVSFIANGLKTHNFSLA
ncbi:MAG: TetR/AcrR family transcriptional regulator [Chitinophagaceae bacterium]